MITLSTINNVKCLSEEVVTLDREYKYIKFIEKRLLPRKFPFIEIFTDISPMEFGLICSFMKFETENDGEHMTVSHIAQDMNCSVPQISRMLKNLEERALISRITDESCRRNTFVVISEKGRELFLKNMQNIRSFVCSVFKKFSDSEMEQMMQLEEKLFTIMESEYAEIKNNKSEKLQEV